MSFDTDELHRILKTHAARIEAFYAGYQRYPFRIEMLPGLVERRFKHHAFAIQDNSMSNHRKLKRDVFIKEAIQDAEQLETWIRKTFPSLDSDCLSFQIEVLNPAKRGDQFKLEINGAGMATGALQMPTLTDRLKRLHDRLAPLGVPTGRFLVNDKEIAACNPTEALRIIVSLYRPDLFDADDPARNTHFTVSEIHEVSIQSAIALS